ncbi:MAG TPA: tyrosine-type recombinase/integrase [Thermomicrobiales bacterium]|nr:tyrosine-type recombinase/integrase [Thermomicrobiales bacterium]
MVRTKNKVDSRLRWGEGSIRRLENHDGDVRYQARWSEGEGKHKRWPSKTFYVRGDEAATKALAEDWLLDVARKKAAGIYAPRNQVTVKGLIEDFLERRLKSEKWQEPTYALYRSRAERHIYPTLGSVKVIELDVPRVQRWIDGMTGARSTLVGQLQVLSGACKMAITLGIIKTNPASGVEVNPTVKPVRRQAWSFAEVVKVLDAVEKDEDPMWHALFRLALSTGLRPGEIVAMQWDQVDFEKNEILVNRGKSVDASGKTVISERTKTGVDRAVALTPLTASALKTWRVEQNQRRLASTTWDERSFVFTSQRGYFLGDLQWRTYQDALADKLEITRIMLHGLRHTSASLDLHTDRKIVADRLGHSSPEITAKIYTHVSADEHRAASEAMEARIEAARHAPKSPTPIAKTGSN